MYTYPEFFPFGINFLSQSFSHSHGLLATLTISNSQKERGIHIEADFWTPHLTNQREFLSQIHMHKDEVRL